MHALASATAESLETIPLRVAQLSFRTHSQLNIAAWFNMACRVSPAAIGGNGPGVSSTLHRLHGILIQKNRMPRRIALPVSPWSRE